MFQTYSLIFYAEPGPPCLFWCSDIAHTGSVLLFFKLDILAFGQVKLWHALFINATRRFRTAPIQVSTQVFINKNYMYVSPCKHCSLAGEDALTGSIEVAVGDDASTLVTFGAFWCLLCLFVRTPLMFLASELGKKKEMENLLEVCLVGHCASQRQTSVVAFTSKSRKKLQRWQVPWTGPLEHRHGFTIFLPFFFVLAVMTWLNGSWLFPCGLTQLESRAWLLEFPGMEGGECIK